MSAASGIKIGSVGGDFSLQAGGDIVAGNKTVINNIIQRFAKELTNTPYKFLSFYDIADRDIFYGRAAVVEQLAGAVVRHKAIIINGASGAGKSSLVNAGLIPRLADNGYSYVTFREYNDPLKQLMDVGKLLAVTPLTGTEIRSDQPAILPRQAAVGAANTSDSEATKVDRVPDLNDPGLLLQLIRAVHATPIVVVFDQFERFFVNVPPHKRYAFIAAFKHCLHHSTAQEINFVLAVRDEFYGQLLLEFEAQIPELSNEAYRLNLMQLTQSEAREAIVKPLENTRLKIQYDEDFVDHVLLAGLAAQTGGSTNVNPPQLQIVCNQLFEAARYRLQQRSSVLIDKQLYNELGGVQTILNTYLDKVVEEAANEPQCIGEVRSLLQRMIDTTGTRRFVSIELLAHELPDVNEAAILTFIRKLLDRRVIEERKPAAQRKTTYSLSHDYMVNRVREWFDQIEMERKRAQETLERGLAEWNNSKALLNRHQVEAVRKWLGSVSPEEQQLLQDSEADYQQKESAERASKNFRRRVGRIGTALAVVVLLVVSALGLISFEESRSALASRAKAQTAQSRFLASLSYQQSEADNGTNAILLALEALPRNIGKPDRPLVIEAEMALYNAVQENREQKILKGHTAPVVSAVFSPDGTRILTASHDKTARLWDAASGHTLAVLQGHTAGVSSAVFSPDGTRILTTSYDKTARLWDAASGRSLAVLQGHTAGVSSAVFSPDGTRIITASGDETARLWDAASAQCREVMRGHTAGVSSAVFSPDGTRILTTSYDKTARLWDAASGRNLMIWQGDNGAIYSAVFSPDGAHVLTVSYDMVAAYETGHSLFDTGQSLYIPKTRLWDVTSGRTLVVLQGHTDWVLSAVYSPDGTRFLTASADNTARLWDATSGQSLEVFRGHQGSVLSAVFSPDGTRILTASADNTARAWYVSSGLSLSVMRGHQGPVLSAAFSPDGTRIVTASADNTAWLWDAASGRSLAVLRGHTAAVDSAGFSPDGTRIVTASDDKTVRLWDAASGRSLAVLRGHTAGVDSAGFSPDGTRIVTASDDKTVRLWDAASGRGLAVLRGHTAGVDSAGFSPDGTRIVTASDDKTVRLWDAASGRSLAVLRGHTDAVFSAAFSPDGTRIVTASADNTAWLWDAATGHSLAVLQGHTYIVNSAEFSPDGARIVTASRDNTARLWDAASGRNLAVLKGHRAGVSSAVFSPDGTRILTASYDKTARLWRTFSTTQSLIDYAYGRSLTDTPAPLAVDK
jgi:WD40 repeat protein